MRRREIGHAAQQKFDLIDFETCRNPLAMLPYIFNRAHGLQLRAAHQHHGRRPMAQEAAAETPCNTISTNITIAKRYASSEQSHLITSAPSPCKVNASPHRFRLGLSPTAKQYGNNKERIQLKRLEELNALLCSTCTLSRHRDENRLLLHVLMRRPDKKPPRTSRPSSHSHHEQTNLSDPNASTTTTSAPG